MSIEKLLTENEVPLSVVICDVLVIKRDECEGELKIHVASPKDIYHFGEYKNFFDDFVRCCPDIKYKHDPYVTGHRNLMFGNLYLKILERDVKIIVYPDSGVANWAISKRNETCIPYSSFVPNDFWSQIQALFI